MNIRSKTSRRWRLSALPAVLAGVVAAALLAPASPAAAVDAPPLETPIATLDAALSCPGSFQHPDREPVLLVHGTSSTADESWGWGYAPALRADGYDVCTVTLPNRAMGDIQVSSEYVVHAIDKINATTGRKVDVIGHSQGPMQIRWALKWWPELQSKVDDAVLLANPGHGLGGGNLLCVAPCAPALHQFSVGSDFLAALNEGDETPGDVSYTSLYSFFDEAIVPHATSPLSGGTNISMQSVCAGRVVTHFSFLYDAVGYKLVLDALSHPGTADPRRLPLGKCLDVNLPGVLPSEAVAATAVAVANLSGEVLNATKTQNEPPLRAYTQS
ncbi:esterase/lipase family protein [Streptomyces sp. NPDC056503]|uniref:esterase/lipase family protein n=1 Tax=Streptomyces sp. NPDC056503 TaxID=3345842 RepID=UPI00368C8342